MNHARRAAWSLSLLGAATGGASLILLLPFLLFGSLEILLDLTLERTDQPVDLEALDGPRFRLLRDRLESVREARRIGPMPTFLLSSRVDHRTVTRVRRRVFSGVQGESLGRLAVWASLVLGAIPVPAIAGAGERRPSARSQSRCA